MIKQAPSVLLPYQQNWVADQSEVKIFVKSRRIGGSWAEAGESALEASRTHGQDTWYIGYTKDMAIEFIRDVADWAKFYSLVASEIEEHEEIFENGDEKKAILAFTIKFASGYRVTALSSSPRNLRGKQGRVVIDESAFHDDLPELLKSALALTIWGGCVRIISTHNGVDNPFNQLVEEVKAGKLPYSLHTCTFDEALAEGLYKRICLKRNLQWTPQGEQEWADKIRAMYADNVDEELNCIPKNSGGRWLSRPLIEQAMSADTPIFVYQRDNEFNLQDDFYRENDCVDWCDEYLSDFLNQIPKGKVFIGGDYGRNGDLTDYVLAVQTTELNLQCVGVVELENIPFTQQEQVLNYICDRVEKQLAGVALDARGIGASNAEKAQHRYGADTVECVKFSQKWYSLNMPPFKAGLEDKVLFNLPKHENTLSDLLAFEIIDGIPKLPNRKNKGANEQARHGDMGIALVLAYYAFKNIAGGGADIRIHTAKPRESTKLLRGFRGFGSMLRGFRR